MGALLALIGGGVFLYSGIYPVAADVHHSRLTYWVLETLRERSISRAASAIKVPWDLGGSERLLAGGADYNDMCATCHLKPGKSESDFTLGLYPTPPNLTVATDDVDTKLQDKKSSGEKGLKRDFWVIKHGIKASGMPAWGPTHDDQRIWNMVAFIQKLPELTPAQYQILTARGGGPGSPEH